MLARLPAALIGVVPHRHTRRCRLLAHPITMPLPGSCAACLTSIILPQLLCGLQHRYAAAIRDRLPPAGRAFPYAERRSFCTCALTCCCWMARAFALWRMLSPVECCGAHSSRGYNGRRGIGWISVVVVVNLALWACFPCNRRKRERSIYHPQDACYSA